MGDQAKFVAGIATVIIFFLLIYCVYVHFTKWRVEDHLRHKKEMADYYQDKYKHLSRRHEYLKRSSTRVAQLYKTHRKINNITQKQEGKK